MIERLISWYRVSSSALAVAVLVGANAIPLFGVLFLDWSVWAVLILYWLENGVVGAFNVAKILAAKGLGVGAFDVVRPAGTPPGAAARIGTAAFFTMHYGLFWLVHGIFVLSMPVFGMIRGGGGSMTEGVAPLAILLALVALTVGHGISFRLDYLGRGEYRRATPGQLVGTPYARLVVLHVTIIGGALAIAFTGAPAAAVAILVTLKTVVDLTLHLREHRPAGTNAPASPTTDRG